MKTFTIAILAWSLIVVQPYAADKHAGPGPTETQSKLWLVGDSSLHAYSSTAHNLKVDFVLVPDKPAFEQLKSGQLKSLEVAVLVREMRSGKKGLDNNMQKTLKAEANPNILFHLANYEVTPSTMPSKGFLIKATGALEIAGVKKDVELDAVLTQENSGPRIQGEEEILMTDYEIKPPKILMIKTSNEVTVHYDLWLDEKGALK